MSFLGQRSAAALACSDLQLCSAGFRLTDTLSCLACLSQQRLCEGLHLTRLDLGFCSASAQVFEASQIILLASAPSLQASSIPGKIFGSLMCTCQAGRHSTGQRKSGKSPTFEGVQGDMQPPGRVRMVVENVCL